MKSDTPRTEGVLLDETLAQYALRHLRLACTHWSGSRDTKGFMDLAESELAAACETRVREAIKELERDLAATRATAQRCVEICDLRNRAVQYHSASAEAIATAIKKEFDL